MAESEEKTSKAELEERVRELKERNQQLEEKVTEYEARLKINQPPQEITLKEYIAKLKSNKAEGKFVLTDVTLDSLDKKYDAVTIAITLTAGIVIPIFWPFIPDLVKHWGYTTVNLFDNEGNDLGFRYFHNLNPGVLEKLEKNYVGHNVRPVVMSYNYKHRFIEGVIKENGEYQSFDKL